MSYRYRPVRVRPYAIDDGVQVAAVWTRDSRTWQIDHDLTAEQIQAKDQELRQEGLIPADISGYIGRDEDGQPADRYASTWVESAEEETEIRMYAGAPVGSEQSQHAEPWSAAGFNRQTMHAFVGQDGGEYRSSIWSKQKDQEDSTSHVFVGIESHFTGEIFPGLLLTDLNVSRTAKPQGTQERSATQLESLEPLLTDRADDVNLRKAVATLRFNLKQDDQALEDLDWLIEKLPEDSRLYQFRAIVHARAKRADEAKQDLGKFTELNNDASQLGYLDAVVSAHLDEFDEQQLPPAEHEQLTVKLLETYATDPDAGIHAASEWVLRRWGQDAQLKEKDGELATGKLEDSRQWFVNKQGQTLVVIPGPIEFVMGSPVDDSDREGGPEGRIETQHRKRINRTFAIMTHEVTVDQFLKFQEEFDYNKQYARDRDHPMNGVTWYAAAEYCNWLSKQEDIPEDDWCYLPNNDKKYAEGMKPAPDYLERSGYRLPTESEWEVACCAGALTSRYFGETEDLLGQYAWYTKNSLDRWMLPVGSLMPNNLGLFDMQGNAMEWCHEVAKHYRVSKTRGLSEDLPDVSEVRDSQVRVLRGGSFYVLPLYVRSAYRYRDQPSFRYDSVGMRAARTYP